MKSYTYKVTNMINNKYYIGITNDVENRWSKHLSIAKLGNPGDGTFYAIHAAIRKYSKENFIFAILREFNSEKDALDNEVFLIKNARQNGDKIYNLTDGGDGVSGYKHSEESKRKNREAHLGVNHPNFGKHLSNITRLEISKNIGSRKLSIDDVTQIKLELNKGELTQKELGVKYNITQSLISNIKRKKIHLLS